MISPDAILFWFLAIVMFFSAVAVITFPNPIFSAVSLIMTMLAVAALFATLNAFFLAGVQLVVYAGAVAVLFVMVLMLFDLKRETKAFSKGLVSGVAKLISAGVFAGLLAGAIFISLDIYQQNLPASSIVNNPNGIASTKALGTILFTQYIFSFEALGLLLLVVAIGAVSLARSKGGTHAKS
jgi:NADH-quinone oxidoreductase subunit J